MTDLKRITERICRLGHPNDPDTPIPLLTIDEFFIGNDVIGSIGCNLASAPPPQAFEKLLRSILQRPDVKDVRIQITDFDDRSWPFSDTIYIMTSAPLEDVSAWFPADLTPDGTWSGFSNVLFEPYVIPQGVEPVACWWD